MPEVPKPSVSLLMTTYRRERAEQLGRSLEMTFAQTRPPDQVVLVIDGPVADDQEQVIARYARDPRVAAVRIVRLMINQGLAAALNAGLEHCTGDWIMRMDSDDKSLAGRTQVQLAYALDHPDVDVIGCWAEEFDDGPATRIKASPVVHDAIVQALKWRNILCHPSIMIRAGTLRKANGYRTNYALLEDWDLFVRLALDGAKFGVVPKVLVRVRYNRGQVARRGGLRYLQNEMRFRMYCWSSGFITTRQYIMTTTVYVAFRLAGSSMRGRLYNVVRTERMAKHA